MTIVRDGVTLIRNTPTSEGRELGSHLARFVQVEYAAHYQRFPNDPEMCRTCAFKAGTTPNGCPTTVMDALKSAMELSPFMCHERVDEAGENNVPCMGWTILVCAKKDEHIPEMPWPFSTEGEP